jgi:hypothetical protein
MESGIGKEESERGYDRIKRIRDLVVLMATSMGE